MRAVPLGASLVLHLGLVAGAGLVVPRASARSHEVVVDLVAAEPPAPATPVAPPPPPLPSPPPPRRLTLPKPIATPPPRVEEPPATPAPPPPAVEAPPSPPSPTPTPHVVSPPAPPGPPSPSGPSATTATATGPRAPEVALPATSGQGSDRAPDAGVSIVQSQPRPSTVASVPGDGGITRVARPTGGYQVRPTYPSTARRLGVQGTTLLRVHVLDDGRVGEVDVEESAGHPDLDQAAADAVRRWRFEPARRGEQAVAMWVRLPVEFRLR